MLVLLVRIRTEQVLKSLREVGINLNRVNSKGTTTGTAFVVVEEDGENQIVVASGANLETCSNQIKIVI